MLLVCRSIADDIVFTQICYEKVFLIYPLKKWCHLIIKYKVKHVLKGIFVKIEDHAYDHNPFAPLFRNHIHFLILAIDMCNNAMEFLYY
jgi:hypothetical protein